MAVDIHILEARIVDDVPQSDVEAHVVVARNQESELAFPSKGRSPYQEGLEVEPGSRGSRHRDVLIVGQVAYVPLVRREILHPAYR